MNVFRPPAISEDSLHYFIHLGFLSSNKYDALALATCFKSHASNLLPGHMWHRDSFELNLTIDESGRYNLEGTMRVGDSIDDEWCVVWLLKDISCRWDVAIRVFDSDGEFLLIEAANTLPDWITPENAENRVWIYEGHLHVIPLEYPSSSPSATRSVHTKEDKDGSSNDDDEYIKDTQTDTYSLLEAVRLVRDSNVNTIAAFEIEHAALERTQKYPQAARQHVHHTLAYLPREIALALLETPELVQKAIETFYTRDALQMRAAARMARFPPTDSVLTTVKLTRTAYAQLMSQIFYPPKSFGIWKDLENSIERRRRDIGMKIACGFEMIYQENKDRSQLDLTDEADTVEALKIDPNYRQYIQKLNELGCFDATRSLDDTKLQEIQYAADYVRGTSSGENNRPSFRKQADVAIARIQNRISEGEIPKFVNREEDSDQWLSDAEHVFENIVSKHTDIITSTDEPLTTDEDTHASKQTTHLRQLANEVQKFIEGEGDIEGALFNDDPNDSEGNSDDESMADDSNTIISAKQAALESLVPSLDPSEYGKMPTSYYNISQKVKELVPEAQNQNSDNGDVSLEVSTRKLGKAPSEVKFIRPLLFPRDEFDGVEDSDDDSDVNAEDDEEEEEEEKPVLVGDIEIDMEDEQEEFIQFSREILGITPELWGSIIADRQNRGIFVPNSASTKELSDQGDFSSYTWDRRKQRSVKELQEGNSKLNSFEAVMDALDIELQRIKNGERGGGEKGITSSDSLETLEEGETLESADIEEEMANELKTMMQEDGDFEHMDYTLIKNFLESFNSQQGLPGPVSNLIGRMGWQLPKDTS